MININENELVIYAIFDSKNTPIGKTELIKTIFLFTKLIGIEGSFEFSNDLFGPNELNNCISIELNRHNYIISDYFNNKNVYYFEPGFFNKYCHNLLEKIEENNYLKLLNNISGFMKCGKLLIKIALIYTIFPEYTENSIIKADLRPFFSNRSLLNNYLKNLLILIPDDLFSEIIEFNKERLKPFIFLSQNNLDTLFNIISLMNETEQFNKIFSSINNLISNVTDVNFKYLLEYIEFIIKKNFEIIKTDSKIKKSIIISLLKLNFETDRRDVHKIMNILRKNKLTYSMLV